MRYTTDLIEIERGYGVAPGDSVAVVSHPLDNYGGRTGTVAGLGWVLAEVRDQVVPIAAVARVNIDGLGVVYVAAWRLTRWISIETDTDDVDPALGGVNGG